MPGAAIMISKAGISLLPSFRRSGKARRRVVPLPARVHAEAACLRHREGGVQLAGVQESLPTLLTGHLAQHLLDRGCGQLRKPGATDDPLGPHRRWLARAQVEVGSLLANQPSQQVLERNRMALWHAADLPPDPPPKREGVAHAGVPMRRFCPDVPPTSHHPGEQRMGVGSSEHSSALISPAGRRSTTHTMWRGARCAGPSSHRQQAQAT